MQRSTIQFTTGTPGSGKSYVRASYWLVNEFLRDGQGVHFSNFPIKRAELVEFAAKRLGRNVEDLSPRVVVIPEDVLAAWRGGTSGPWETFATVDLSGAHIAIDEAHHYIGSKQSLKQKKAWQAWLGEIRHRGATVEFLTQAKNKCAREIWDEAVVWLSLVNSEEERDPFCRILMRDWYELRAKVTGEYRASVWAFEKRQVDGRWKQEDKRSFALLPEYFELYDSFSAPQAGGLSGKPDGREFQKRTWPGLLFWFFRRNWWRFGRTAFVCALVVWLLCGGGTVAFNHFLKEFSKIGQKQMAAAGGARGEVADRGGAAGPGVAPMADLTPMEVQRVRYEKQIGALNDSLRNMREKFMEQSARLAAYDEAERARSGFGALIPGGVWTVGGDLVRVGEAVPEGELKGEVVSDVDVAGRKVVLASGRVVRVSRRLPVQAASSEGADASALRGSVPRSEGGQAESAGDRGGDRYEANPVGGRSAAGGVREDGGQPDGRVRSRGPSVGTGAGNGGPGQSNGRGDAWDSSSPLWRAGDENGQPVLRGEPAAGGQGRNGASGASSRF